MNSFVRFAFFTIARDASFVALAGAILMVAFSFDPGLSLFVGAAIALLFTLILILRFLFLSEEAVARSEPWRALAPHERPSGEGGMRIACEEFEFLLLRFAKGASAVAIALFGFSLVMSIR
jgi:hypothetical protein